MISVAKKDQSAFCMKYTTRPLNSFPFLKKIQGGFTSLSFGKKKGKKKNLIPLKDKLLKENCQFQLCLHLSVVTYLYNLSS